jgi:hypothetical protein
MSVWPQKFRGQSHLLAPPNGASVVLSEGSMSMGPAGFLEGNGKGLFWGCVCVLGQGHPLVSVGCVCGCVCLCWVCVSVVGWRGDAMA